MSGQKPQIDYDALADQARKQATSAVPAPKKAAQPAAVDYDALAAQARQAQVPAPPTPAVAPAPQEGFWASAVSPFVGMAQGLRSAVYEGPQNPTEAAIVGGQPGVSLWDDATPIVGRAVLAAKRMLIDPQVDQGKQSVSAFKQSAPLSLHPTPGQLEQRQLALGHGLAAVLPMLGPWAANVGEKEGEQLAAGNYQGATGTAFGNAALALAPKGISKVAGSAPEAAQSLVRRLAGSGPAVTKNLVRAAAEDNRAIDLHNADKVADAKQAHADAQAQALAAHEDATLRAQQAYKKKVNEARDKAVGGTAADRAKYQSEQQAAKMQFDTEMREANDAFAKARDEAQRNNLAAENMLDLRRKAEQTYQQATDDYRAQNAAADVRAKGEENSAWSAFRQKVTGKGINSEQIIEPLKRIEVLSPEVAQSLRKLQISPEDAPLDSEFAKDRAAVMKASGYAGNYFDYPADVRASFNRAAMAHGFEPDLIDFNPQAGQTLPVDLVQRASSIIQGYLRDRRFDGNGPVRGEMMQLAKTLRAAVTRAAAEVGATAELDAARNATIVRQGAFGKPPRKVVTTSSNLERDANPEADDVRAKEEALDRARRYDPTLVDSYRQVKAARLALKNFPDEDQLRAGLKQVPRAPSTPQLRLQPPGPEPRAENIPLPPIIYDQGVTPVAKHRTVPYHEPKLSPRRTLSGEDIQRANEAAVQKRAAGMTGYLLRLAVVWPAFRMLSELTKGQSISPRSLAVIPAAGVAGAAAEGLLSHPAVMDFLTRTTRQQIAEIPLDLRGQMPEIVAAAKAKGVPVSPILAAYAAAVQRNRTGQQTGQAVQPTPTQGATQ